MFIVMVDDPSDAGRRYYGPFDTNDEAERYAAPLRGSGVHAVVSFLWDISDGQNVPPEGVTDQAYVDAGRIRMRLYSDGSIVVDSRNKRTSYVCSQLYLKRGLRVKLEVQP